MQAVASHTSQVNTRVDTAIKAQAEEVLELMGSSTAELVRAVFAKIAGGARGYEELAAVLAPHDAARDDALLEEGWAIADAFYAKIGFDAATAPADTRSWSEILDEAKADHFSDKGVIL